MLRGGLDSDYQRGQGGDLGHSAYCPSVPNLSGDDVRAVAVAADGGSRCHSRAGSIARAAHHGILRADPIRLRAPSVRYHPLDDRRNGVCDHPCRHSGIPAPGAGGPSPALARPCSPPNLGSRGHCYWCHSSDFVARIPRKSEARLDNHSHFAFCHLSDRCRTLLHREPRATAFPGAGGYCTADRHAQRFARPALCLRLRCLGPRHRHHPL